MDVTFPSGSEDTMPRPLSVITLPESASNNTKCGIPTQGEQSLYKLNSCVHCYSYSHNWRESENNNYL